MRKIKRLIFIASFIIGVAFQMEASQCSGGTPIYWCSAQTLSDAISDADLNCCEGSEIVLINCETNVAYHHYVEEDGLNSSCTFE